MNTPLRLIDDILNRITMYRLVLYALSALAVISFTLSVAKIIPATPLALFQSLVVLLFVSYVSNFLFSKIFHAQLNTESQWISAFILFFIIEPGTSLSLLWIPALAACIAMSSKYLFAIGKKHIFNPVAITLVILALFGRGEAIWWVGNPIFSTIIFFLGILILRKLRHFELFFGFAVSALLAMLYFGLTNGMVAIDVIKSGLLSWPLLFFGVFMLTEPQTTPPTRISRVLYGVLVGLLFGLPFHLALFGFVIYSSPALALVLGNLVSYIISPKQKLILYLKEKKEIAQNTFQFVFSSKQKLQFAAGQYLEWTLPHKNGDSRGSRRYFTIASSPTEETINLGIKYSPNASSSFKKALVAMDPQTFITASQLSGEFVLPKNKKKKLVFIAGGIGVTPFRSMIKYLLDTNEKRDIVLFYSNKTFAEIAYRDIFEEARLKLGIKTIYTLTDPNTPPSWEGKRGYVTAEMIKEEAPDFLEREFYISGPHGMVTTFEEALGKMGVPERQIKIDFFPGFA